MKQPDKSNDHDSRDGDLLRLAVDVPTAVAVLAARARTGTRIVSFTDADLGSLSPEERAMFARSLSGPVSTPLYASAYLVKFPGAYSAGPFTLTQPEIDTASVLRDLRARLAELVAQRDDAADKLRAVITQRADDPEPWEPFFVGTGRVAGPYKGRWELRGDTLLTQLASLDPEHALVAEGREALDGYWRRRLERDRSAVLGMEPSAFIEDITLRSTLDPYLHDAAVPGALREAVKRLDAEVDAEIAARCEARRIAVEEQARAAKERAAAEKQKAEAERAELVATWAPRFEAFARTVPALAVVVEEGFQPFDAVVDHLADAIGAEAVQREIGKRFVVYTSGKRWDAVDMEQRDRASAKQAAALRALRQVVKALPRPEGLEIDPGGLWRMTTGPDKRTVFWVAISNPLGADRHVIIDCE